MQGLQIAKKTLRESGCDGEVEIKYDGENMCEKGNAYMVDCTVRVVDA